MLTSCCSTLYTRPLVLYRLVEKGLRQYDVTHTTRRQAYQLVMLQAVVVLLVALLFCIKNIHSSGSVLLGGLCSVLPSALYTYWLFRRMEARAARRIVAVFYVGELAKLVLSAVLAVTLLMTLKVVVLPFFIGFLVAHFAFMLAPMVGLFK